jgi:hypothetical protein
MKSGFVRLAVSAVIALSSPLFVFAGGQPAKVFTPSKAEMQDRAGITRALQQGKGSGISRSQAPLPASAPRTQTAVRLSDTAFTK